MEEYRTFAWVPNDDRNAHQIRWKGWPGHNVDGGDHSAEVRLYNKFLVCRYKYIIFTVFPAYTKPLKYQAHHIQVLDTGILNCD